MTLAMPDSIRVADLPPGYPAYLGYADGHWPTAAQLAARFPAAKLVILTVTGTTLRADGIDCEPGNPSAFNAVYWAGWKLSYSPPGTRPVIYASVIGAAGYGMGDVLGELDGQGIDRSRVRLLSAHYGKGRHICGPGSCGAIDIDMDGTQWTDAFNVRDLFDVDMSELRDDFFNQSSSRTERLVRELPVVRQGDTGEAVKTVQGLCNARLAGHPAPTVPALVIDGVFGWKTQGTVEFFQADAKIAQDGVVGPQTWPVLLGIAP